MEIPILPGLQQLRITEKSLPEQVADQIRGLIIQQHLVAGAKIPTEIDMATQLKVGAARFERRSNCWWLEMSWRFAEGMALLWRIT